MAAEPRPCLFIQFAREPVPGAVKTRMIPHLTPAQACDLHSELVLWTAATLAAARLGPVELAVAGNSNHALFQRCRALGVAALGAQEGRDLGERMYRALAHGLRRFERVVLVGSDCPDLDRDYLELAVGALDRAEIVLGPATDGGYVLIGARRVCPAMFEGIPWGEASVFARTTGALRKLQLGWEELPALADIDRPDDLALWATLRAARDGRGSGAG